ncbi:hypothetical protein, partial [Escherichia coli]|uniref:hypothetical protein n=1 Tax=Escherichia coli TaxID=562 RepID=UPI001C707BD8
LTRPPLVSEAASCFLLPFDLHVLGLPPAFNLSHDQTLQFKSLMLNQRSSKLLPVTVRLACVRPAASVQSEP